jgi:hypothetical protein
VPNPEDDDRISALDAAGSIAGDGTVVTAR